MEKNLPSMEDDDEACESSRASYEIRDNQVEQMYVATERVENRARIIHQHFHYHPAPQNSITSVSSSLIETWKQYPFPDKDSAFAKFSFIILGLLKKKKFRIEPMGISFFEPNPLPDIITFGTVMDELHYEAGTLALEYFSDSTKQLIAKWEKKEIGIDLSSNLELFKRIMVVSDGYANATVGLLLFKRTEDKAELKVLEEYRYEDGAYLSEDEVAHLNKSIPVFDGTQYEEVPKYLKDHGISIQFAFNQDTKDQLGYISTWYRKCCSTTRLINKNRTTYGYKHEVENWWNTVHQSRDYVYIANDTIKVFFAFKKHLLSKNDADGINLCVNIKVHE